MSLTSRDFKKQSACVQRPLGLSLQTANNRFFDESNIAKEMIRAHIKGEYNPIDVNEVRDDIEAAMSDEVIDDIKDNQIAAINRLSEVVWRYINSVKANYYDCQFIVPDDPINLDLTQFIDKRGCSHFYGDDSIDVKFDFIAYNNERIIGVIIKRGLPTLNIRTGAKSPDTDIWLHMMRFALRRFADSRFPKDKSVVICAQYHHLKKPQSKSISTAISTNVLTEDYFANDNGIRGLIESYTPSAQWQFDTYPMSEFDTILLGHLEKYATGYDKCDLKEEDDCKHCPNYLSCYFKAPPVLIESDDDIDTIKPRAPIVPDEYQKEVMDIRQGTVLVDAPPGAGKTAVTTERTTNMLFEMLDDCVAQYEAGIDIEIPVSNHLKCKRGDGLDEEILVNGKSATQNWSDVLVDLSKDVDVTSNETLDVDTSSVVDNLKIDDGTNNVANDLLAEFMNLANDNNAQSEQAVSQASDDSFFDAFM